MTWSRGFIHVDPGDSDSMKPPNGHQRGEGSVTGVYDPDVRPCLFHGAKDIWVDSEVIQQGHSGNETIWQAAQRGPPSSAGGFPVTVEDFYNAIRPICQGVKKCDHMGAGVIHQKPHLHWQRTAAAISSVSSWILKALVGSWKGSHRIDSFMIESGFDRLLRDEHSIVPIWRFDAAKIRYEHEHGEK